MHAYSHTMVVKPSLATVTRMHENLGQGDLGHVGRAGRKEVKPARQTWWDRVPQERK